MHSDIFLHPCKCSIGAGLVKNSTQSTGGGNVIDSPKTLLSAMVRRGIIMSVSKFYDAGILGAAGISQAYGRSLLAGNFCQQSLWRLVSEAGWLLHHRQKQFNSTLKLQVPKISEEPQKPSKVLPKTIKGFTQNHQRFYQKPQEVLQNTRKYINIDKKTRPRGAVGCKIFCFVYCEIPGKQLFSDPYLVLTLKIETTGIK
jgi:hypothetical protein